MTDLTNNSKVYRGTIMLCVLAVGMFGFAYALVPLYEVFCELTGINGKTSGQSVELLETESDSGRVGHSPVSRPRWERDAVGISAGYPSI